MTRSLLLAALLIAMGACTSVHHISGPHGEPLILVECGAASSIGLCHDKAKSVCAHGYKTISEDDGFNRKTLTIQCMEDKS